MNSAYFLSRIYAPPKKKRNGNFLADVILNIIRSYCNCPQFFRCLQYQLEIRNKKMEPSSSIPILVGGILLAAIFVAECVVCSMMIYRCCIGKKTRITSETQLAELGLSRYSVDFILSLPPIKEISESDDELELKVSGKTPKTFKVARKHAKKRQQQRSRSNSGTRFIPPPKPRYNAQHITNKQDLKMLRLKHAGYMLSTPGSK